MIEWKLLPILTLVVPIEPGRPFDPDLVLLGDVNRLVAIFILVSFKVFASDILSAELDTGLNCGWPDKRDQGLNVDNSPEVRKTVPLEVGKVMFCSRLKLNITKVGAAISKFLRRSTRVVEDQNLSGRIAEDNRDPTFLALVWLDLVKHLAVALGVKTQDSPIAD